jgi:uncharacterized membrane protein HdeD (DUF308 family)
MFKDLISWSLVLIGVAEIINFFSHHTGEIPVNDGNSHALVGIVLVVAGVFLLKTKISFDSWTKFR